MENNNKKWTPKYNIQKHNNKLKLTFEEQSEEICKFVIKENNSQIALKCSIKENIQDCYHPCNSLIFSDDITNDIVRIQIFNRHLKTSVEKTQKSIKIIVFI